MKTFEIHFTLSSMLPVRIFKRGPHAGQPIVALFGTTEVALTQSEVEELCAALEYVRSHVEANDE